MKDTNILDPSFRRSQISSQVLIDNTHLTLPSFFSLGKASRLPATLAFDTDYHHRAIPPHEKLSTPTRRSVNKHSSYTPK